MVRLSRFYSLSKTMNNLLSIEQLTGDEIRDLLALGHRLKAESGHHERLPLKGQTWALIFSKSSTRTRVSALVNWGGVPCSFPSKTSSSGVESPSRIRPACWDV